MIYYMVRHKESGDYMPELRRGRGYTHWNPSTKSMPQMAKLIGVPRLLPSRRTAQRVIVQWAAMPNARYSGYTSYDGEDDYDISIKDDGRKKEDLEVVEVSIEEVK